MSRTMKKFPLYDRCPGCGLPRISESCAFCSYGKILQRQDRKKRYNETIATMRFDWAKDALKRELTISKLSRRMDKGFRGGEALRNDIAVSEDILKAMLDNKETDDALSERWKYDFEF